MQLSAFLPLVLLRRRCPQVHDRPTRSNHDGHTYKGAYRVHIHPRPISPGQPNVPGRPSRPSLQSPVDPHHTRVNVIRKLGLQYREGASHCRWGSQLHPRLRGRSHCPPPAAAPLDPAGRTRRGCGPARQVIQDAAAGIQTPLPPQRHTPGRVSPGRPQPQPQLPAHPHAQRGCQQQPLDFFASPSPGLTVLGAAFPAP